MDKEEGGFRSRYLCQLANGVAMHVAEVKTGAAMAPPALRLHSCAI